VSALAAPLPPGARLVLALPAHPTQDRLRLSALSKRGKGLRHTRAMGLTRVTNNTAKFERVKGLALANSTLPGRRRETQPLRMGLCCPHPVGALGTTGELP